MDRFTKAACFGISLEDCRYKATCPQVGFCPCLQTPENSLKHPELFTPDHAESVGDIKTFLMLKKVFSLRETGYWRS